MVLWKRYAVLAAVLVLGAGLFWYFIGGTFSMKAVQDVIPSGIILKQGSFILIDRIHHGSGDAKIIKVQDTYYLVLENFQVTIGPDLYVYTSRNGGITTEENLGEFTEISLLKGNRGNQMYLLTPEQAENAESIVIWCKRFGVLFSSATLN